MISRRKIISRSLDNLDAIGVTPEEEEDVWYDKEKLFRDHINEVLTKWEQIDDEIWAKIIVFEKNRRVAKAYARSSVISINGSKNGFDGVRIGLNGFDNPMRDSETKSAKRAIGDGFKIKMDEIGNILIKRYGKSGVFVQNTSLANEETVIGADILKMPNMALNIGTSAKLFDIRKYTTNINREFARPYPESSRLERQCLSAVSIVKSDNNLINCPLWILVINVVAIDMLKNRLMSLSKSISIDTVVNGTRIATNLEDPYSTIESQVGLIYPSPSCSDDSNNSNNSSKSRRSVLNGVFGYLDESPYVPKPDYEIYNSSHLPILPPSKSNKSQLRKKQDDPYYCGLLARIPNFIKSSKPSKSKKESKMARKISASQYLSANHHPQPAQPIPIAKFHQYPAHAFLPMYPYNHRLSQSQMSLWDSRSLISAHGKLSDYVSTAEIAGVFTTGGEIITRKTPGKQNSQQNDKLVTPRKNAVYCEIQRNLTNPANVRIRAVKCFKDPTKEKTMQANQLSPVRNGIRTTIPSIQDVMKDIVVYVEVRTGEDNRSAGVRKVIAALGARVNNKLLRSTTHVVFKDGLLSTYKKAKSMEIPIVSILWIEACKNELRICDPADFPISNLDRYENPELYEKLKPMRSRSESATRVRVKRAIKGSQKSTPQLEEPKSSQSNITNFFKSQDHTIAKTPSRMLAGSAVESPVTLLLNRISSNMYTPIANTKTKSCAKESSNLHQNENTSLQSQNSQESLIKNNMENQITATTNCIAQISLSAASETKEHGTQTQKKNSLKRRRILGPVKSPTKNLTKVSNEVYSKKQTSIVLMTDKLVSRQCKSSQDLNIESSIGRRTTYSYMPMDVEVGIETTPTSGSHSERPSSIRRRRTLFTPQRLCESPKDMITNCNGRRTTFTPQNMIESQIVATSVVKYDSTVTQHHIISTPQSIIETPKNSPAGTINEETTSNYVVTPSSISINRRRRTLFDLSMDIISHQVSHLNSKTRLSIAPPNNDNTNVTTPKSESNTNSCIKESQIGPQNKCENAENVENDTMKNMISESNENSSISTNDPGGNIMSAGANTADKKKRKLFKPIEMSPFTPPRLAVTASIASSRKSLSTPLNMPKTVTKRRRTLLQKQSSNPEVDLINTKVIPMENPDSVSKNKSSSLESRRSTMDFESIQQINKRLQDQQMLQPNEKENNSQLSTENINDIKILSRKRIPFLAFTNMHKEQVDVINEAVQKLGKFKLDRCVCSASTHMVSLEPRRTMNLLRGLVRGLWILDYSWIVDSLKVGYWLPEEPYEMKDFSRAVEICRAERQAFGNNYKCELFADLGAFFISPRCDNIPIRELKELIRLCGGKIEDHRQNAKFILSSCTKAFDDKIYVTPLWILDSITQMQLMRIQKYSAITQLPTAQTVSNTRNMPTAIEVKDSQHFQSMDRINCSKTHPHARSPNKMVVDSRLSAIYSRTCTS